LYFRGKIEDIDNEAATNTAETFTLTHAEPNRPYPKQHHLVARCTRLRDRAAYHASAVVGDGGVRVGGGVALVDCAAGVARADLVGDGGAGDCGDGGRVSGISALVWP
jgi:hypothetical protein